MDPIGGDQEAHRLFESGLRLYRSGQPGPAMALFQESVARDPTFADGYNHIALLFFEDGDYKRAEQEYERARRASEASLAPGPADGVDFWRSIERRPYLRALHGLGRCLLRRGEVEAAIRAWNRLVELNPGDHLQVRELVGMAYHRLGKLATAMPFYRGTIARPAGAYSLALGLFQGGSYGEAILHLRRAFFLNVYIPLVIGNRRSRRPAAIAEAPEEEADYAYRYAKDSGPLWSAAEGAVSFLRTVHEAPPVAAALDRFVEERAAIRAMPPGASREFRRRRLASQTGLRALRADQEAIAPPILARLGLAEG